MVKLNLWSFLNFFSGQSEHCFYSLLQKPSSIIMLLISMRRCDDFLRKKVWQKSRHFIRVSLIAFVFPSLFVLKIHNLTLSEKVNHFGIHFSSYFKFVYSYNLSSILYFECLMIFQVISYNPFHRNRAKIKFMNAKCSDCIPPVFLSMTIFIHWF